MRSFSIDLVKKYKYSQAMDAIISLMAQIPIQIKINLSQDHGSITYNHCTKVKLHLYIQVLIFCLVLSSFVTTCFNLNGLLIIILANH